MEQLLDYGLYLKRISEQTDYATKVSIVKEFLSEIGATELADVLHTPDTTTVN